MAELGLTWHLTQAGLRMSRGVVLRAWGSGGAADLSKVTTVAPRGALVGPSSPGEQLLLSR